jgi:outer membrane protein
MKKVLVIIVSFFVLGFYADRASAQELIAPRPIGLDKMIGVAGVAVPDYDGSDDYTYVAAPLIFYKFGGTSRYLQLVGNKLYFNILNHENLEFGLLGIYRLGRASGSIDDDVVSKISAVDSSIEVGGFLGYAKKFDNNPRHRMNIHLDVTQDVSDGHEGLLASFSGVYWRPLAKAFDIGFRGNVTYANDDYMSAFFDVTANDSAVSGLQQFDAEDGFKDAGVQLMGLLHLSKAWKIGAGVQYKKLFGDAEDSPVVDQRGDANQVTAGVALMYAW